MILYIFIGVVWNAFATLHLDKTEYYSAWHVVRSVCYSYIVNIFLWPYFMYKYDRWELIEDSI